MDNTLCTPSIEIVVDVRTAILQAGSALLKEQGIAALTQPKVARVAGVKQSHLTYYFPKRADLLLGIAAHTIDGLMIQLSARLATATPQTALLETLSAAMVDGIPPRIMLGLIVAADEEPGLRPALGILIRSVRARIQAALEQAGLPNSETAALLLHAVVVGLAVMHQAQRTPASAEDIRNGMTEIIERLGADGMED